MGARRKKSNRRYRRGRTYFCAHCGYYSWLDGNNIINRAMWQPEDRTAKATSRTCSDCRLRP